MSRLLSRREMAQIARLLKESGDLGEVDTVPSTWQPVCIAARHDLTLSRTP
jgi:hypothetical protein